MSFNYLGQFDQKRFDLGVIAGPALRIAGEPTGSAHSPQARRAHLIEINAAAAGEGLRVEWTYSPQAHRRESIEGLAESFMQELRGLIREGEVGGGDSYTPADFPLASMSQQQMKRVVGGQADVEDIYPLSPMQHGLLFHTLYSPESEVYFEQVVSTFQGHVEVLVFERAWQQVVNRHASLRTAFIWEDLDEPHQVTLRRVDLSLNYLDWRGLSPIEQEEQLGAYLKADRRRGFDLSKAPLMRLALIQMGEDTYRFIWSLHHLLVDGWSLSIILREVSVLYEAYRQGKDLYLEPSPPYREYIAWLKMQDVSKGEEFWRELLKGFTAPTTALPAISGVARQTGEEQSWDEQQISLPEETMAALRSLSSQNQLTLNTLVLGMWALLLSRYSNEQDVVFGSIFSGRPVELAGVESIVGLFVNTLPVRVQVPPESLLMPWLKKLQEQLVEIRQHEHSPLIAVQRWSEIQRGVPLFDSIFVFENYPVDEHWLELQQLGTLKVDQVYYRERTNYPLTVIVIPGRHLCLRIIYDQSRFDANTIRRLLGHFKTLLESFIENPKRRLSDLDILTQAERNQLLVDWNRTGREFRKDACIHHLFEEQVRRSPSATALICSQDHICYSLLNARANRLAHFLIQMGVGPEARVAICLNRSVDMVVAVLAALKAGGAYVPLDPAYPPHRLRYMLDDSRALVLLTQASLLHLFHGQTRHILCLDSQADSFARLSQADPTQGRGLTTSPTSSTLPAPQAPLRASPLSTAAPSPSSSGPPTPSPTTTSRSSSLLLPSASTCRYSSCSPRSARAAPPCLQTTYCSCLPCLSTPTSLSSIRSLQPWPSCSRSPSCPIRCA